MQVRVCTVFVQTPPWVLCTCLVSARFSLPLQQFPSLDFCFFPFSFFSFLRLQHLHVSIFASASPLHSASALGFWCPALPSLFSFPSSPVLIPFWRLDWLVSEKRSQSNLDFKFIADCHDEWVRLSRPVRSSAWRAGDRDPCRGENRSGTERRVRVRVRYESETERD